MPRSPDSTFTITVQGEQIRVEYREKYLGDRDHFAFTNTEDPPRPHPLSPTGYRSQFAARIAVLTAGGPEAYAARYAEEFLAEQEGRTPGKPARRGKKQTEPPAGEDGSTAGDPRQWVQGELF